MGDVAFDGTKVLANASKHKAMSYARMREKVEQYHADKEWLVSPGRTAHGSDQIKPPRGPPSKRHLNSRSSSAPKQVRPFTLLGVGSTGLSRKGVIRLIRLGKFSGLDISGMPMDEDVAEAL